MSKERALFSKRLVEARHRAGLTQQQLADKVGLTVTAVSRHERLSDCTALPEGVVLRGYATELGVSVDWLLGLSSVSCLTDQSERITPEVLAEFLFYLAVSTQNSSIGEWVKDTRIEVCLQAIRDAMGRLSQEEVRRLLLPSLIEAVRATA